MRDFIEKQLDQCWKNLDKLLMTWLFVMAMGSALYISTHAGMDEGTLDWARTVTVSIFSVLAGLVGGVAIGKSQAGATSSTTITHTEPTILSAPKAPESDPPAEPKANG